MEARRFYVITGGTLVHVAPHFSLCAPAYGKVGVQVAQGLIDAFFEARKREGSLLQSVYLGDGRTDMSRPAGGEYVVGPPQARVTLLRTKMAAGEVLRGRDGFTAAMLEAEREIFVAAGLKVLETNEDLGKLIDYLIAQPDTKGIVLAAAVCDWEPYAVAASSYGLDLSVQMLEDLKVDYGGPDSHLDPGSFSYNGGFEGVITDFGKRMPRLKTSDGNKWLAIRPANKLISKIRRTRKDIFLVGFKATTGCSEQEQYISGLGLLKGASCNLVFANDVHEHLNMVVTPEEAKYHVTKNRKAALRGLCEMIVARSNLHFTRSTVVEGDPIPWGSSEVPDNLRKVVDHCIARGAYKPFQGKTVGHFATRGPKPGIIYTSRRKSNFNNLSQDGLLRIDMVGDDQVIAHGAKPSVGGQSQRIIFEQHPDVDCIVHAHVPLRMRDSGISVREQRPFECGSMECGRNTSEGLLESEVPGIKAVMLDEHGPNICFSKDTDPDAVIAFIEKHWDLEAKTGGPVSL